MENENKVIPTTDSAEISENEPVQEEVIAEMEPPSESKPEEKPIRKVPKDVSENSKKVFMVLSDEPVTTDYISAKTGMPIHELLSALTELEIFGYIESVVGGKYIAKG